MAVNQEAQAQQAQAAAQQAQPGSRRGDERRGAGLDERYFKPQRRELVWDGSNHLRNTETLTESMESRRNSSGTSSQDLTRCSSATKSKVY